MIRKIYQLVCESCSRVEQQYPSSMPTLKATINHYGFRQCKGYLSFADKNAPQGYIALPNTKVLLCPDCFEATAKFLKWQTVRS
jgi:hypothetical protein